MKVRRSSLLILVPILMFSCSQNQKKEEEKESFLNKGHELVAKMTEKVGNHKMLREKNDVVYTYRYETPDGKVDISTEKYLFKGELSYGYYKRHDRTFPDLEGPIEQGYDGNEFWLKHGEELITDSAKLASVAFKRPTNFYWFAMFQKLLSPGVNYEYLGEKTTDEGDYDIVNITYDSNGEKLTDIYQLYINKETLLVDFFLFTVADYGKMETPFLMQLEYEEIDEILIPTKRKYKKSTWEAEISDEPWISVTWTDIKFDNGLSKKDFQK